MQGHFSYVKKIKAYFTTYLKKASKWMIRTRAFFGKTLVDEYVFDYACMYVDGLMSVFFLYLIPVLLFGLNI